MANHRRNRCRRERAQDKISSRGGSKRLPGFSNFSGNSRPKEKHREKYKYRWER